MEIPCILEFTGEVVNIEKVKQLIKEAPVGQAQEVKDSNTSVHMDGVDLTITSHSDSEGCPSMKKQKIFVLVRKLLMMKQLKMIGSTQERFYLKQR